MVFRSRLRALVSRCAPAAVRRWSVVRDAGGHPVRPTDDSFAGRSSDASGGAEAPRGEAGGLPVRLSPALGATPRRAVPACRCAQLIHERSIRGGPRSSLRAGCLLRPLRRPVGTPPVRRREAAGRDRSPGVQQRPGRPQRSWPNGGFPCRPAHCARGTTTGSFSVPALKGRAGRVSRPRPSARRPAPSPARVPRPARRGRPGRRLRRRSPNPTRPDGPRARPSRRGPAP